MLKCRLNFVYASTLKDVNTVSQFPWCNFFHPPPPPLPQPSFHRLATSGCFYQSTFFLAVCLYFLSFFLGYPSWVNFVRATLHYSIRSYSSLALRLWRNHIGLLLWLMARLFFSYTIGVARRRIFNVSPSFHHGSRGGQAYLWNMLIDHPLRLPQPLLPLNILQSPSF